MSETATPTQDMLDQMSLGNVFVPAATSASRMMPAGLASALVRVMGQIRSLKKSDANQHDGYRYASTDDFFEMCGPLLAKEGVLIIPNEVEWDIRETTNRRGETRAILILTFEFYLYDNTGAGWIPPKELKKSVNVMAGGPQSWGQAQSYAMKQFLRGLFQIPAHDPREEADASASYEMDEVPQSSRSTRPKRGSRPSAPPTAEPRPADHPAPDETPVSAPDLIAAFADLLDTAVTVEEAETILTSFRKGEAAKRLSAEDKALAIGVYNARMKTLMNAALDAADYGQTAA